MTTPLQMAKPSPPPVSKEAEEASQAITQKMLETLTPQEQNWVLNAIRQSFIYVRSQKVDALKKEAEVLENLLSEL